MDKLKVYLKNKYLLSVLMVCGALVLGLAGIVIVNDGNAVIIESEGKTSSIAEKPGTGTADQQGAGSARPEAAAGGSTAEASTGSNESGENQIKVYVVGCVNNPGLVTLKKGQLVGDAIEAAGGATAEADIYNINLAYKLNDNAMIKVKAKDEEGQGEGVPQEAGSSADIIYDAGSGIIADTGEDAQGAPSGNQAGKKVNINTAGIEELDTLPGIGEATARSIIEYREKNGGFKTIEDIMNITGIKENKFAKIKDLIYVE